jgi:hypothetical protein
MKLMRVARGSGIFISAREARKIFNQVTNWTNSVALFVGD